MARVGPQRHGGVSVDGCERLPQKGREAWGSEQLDAQLRKTC